MPLAVGTKAPDFTLSTKTADGPKQIRLSENFGKGKHIAAFLSDGVHGHVHHGNV